MRSIAKDFISTDPIIAMVLAAHVAAARRYSIAFDGLPIKSRAGGSPVLKGAAFEIEVERAAVFAGGEDTFGRGGNEW